MVYSRKNPNTTAQERGLRTWNFQEYWRKSMWKFQESIKKEVEFPRVFKKNPCGISMGLGFWPWNFQSKGVSNNFVKFPPMVKLVFSPEFLSKLVRNFRLLLWIISTLFCDFLELKCQIRPRQALLTGQT